METQLDHLCLALPSPVSPFSLTCFAAQVKSNTCVRDSFIALPLTSDTWERTIAVKTFELTKYVVRLQIFYLSTFDSN